MNAIPIIPGRFFAGTCLLSILFAEQPGPGATMGSRWHNAGRLKERKPDSKKRQPEWTEGQLDSASGTEDARRDEVLAELWFVI